MNTYLVRTFAGEETIQADRMEIQDGMITFVVIAPEEGDEDDRAVKVFAQHYVKTIEERPEQKPVASDFAEPDFKNA